MRSCRLTEDRFIRPDKEELMVHGHRRADVNWHNAKARANREVFRTQGFSCHRFNNAVLLVCSHHTNIFLAKRHTVNIEFP